jgi:hypothetical protein
MTMARKSPRYEVQMCGMKDDGEGGLTYCDTSREAPKVWNVYVRDHADPEDPELEDEDFDTLEEADARASELITKYGDCPFERYRFVIRTD